MTIQNIFLLCFSLTLLGITPLLSQTFTNHNIVDNFDNLRRIMPGDLDNDGDMDLVVLAASSTIGTLFCLENVDGTFNINDSVTIQNGYRGARGLAVGDIDGDSDMDVCVTGKDSNLVVWWANDGDPFDGTSFGNANINETGGGYRIYNVEIADIDGTNGNDLTVAYARGDDVAYWENDGASTPDFTEHIVNDSTADTLAFAVWVNSADINNDGLLDIVSTANDFIYDLDGRITWFENDGSTPDGGFTNAWSSTDINATQHFPFVSWTHDIDRDGDMDVLVGANDGPRTTTLTLVLYWNESNGSSWSSSVIDPDFHDAEYVFARDMDGDGDIDLLACNDLGILRVYKNDGSLIPSFTEQINIASDYYGARTIYPVDLDYDGDPDIISVALDADSIDWWENDAEDEQIVASGDSSLFWYDNLEVIVNSSTGGSDAVTVFYDSEQVPDTTMLGTGVNSILPEGFYTLTTEKSTFDMTLKFSYNSTFGWDAYTNENDLVICRWDGSQWVKAGVSQTIDVVNDTIVVNNVTELGRFALAEADYILANIKVFLEGPYSVAGDTMFTDLLDDEVIPLSQPFNVLPWNYSGSEIVSQVPNDIVDWVLIEIRTGTTASDAVDTTAAFLRNDGMIVDLDGSNQVDISNLVDDSYYVVVYHRNHLAVMTSSTIALNQMGSTLYNFSTGISQYYESTGATEIETGVWGMISGDGNHDGGVYGEDYTLYRLNQGTESYHMADFNMDGGVYGEDYTIYRLNQGLESSVPTE